MRSPMSFAFAGAVATAALLGCGGSTTARDGGGPTTVGGSIPGGGGAAGASALAVDASSLGTGGVGAAGTQDGGTVAVGGREAATGGADGPGGAAGGVGGKGGATVGGVGGAGGRTGQGGASAAGGRGNPGGTPGTGGGVTGAGGTGVLGGSTGAGGNSVAPPFPPKFFGNIDSRDTTRPDFATYWDQFTPENIGKWAWVQPSSGNSFNWERLDAAYRYCEDNKIVFKEHCFIWGPAQAAWITSDNAVAAVQNWMKAFCDRYPNTRLIDVVNEPLHNTPSYVNAIGGGNRTTYDWITNSFKWAREACPNAILILNDYNTIEYRTEHEQLITLTKTILAAGAPVMAIGAQAHDVAKVPAETVRSYIADIVSQTGLPVYITELDLPIADDAQQAAVLKDFVTTYWNDPSVPGITYWGYVNGYTWRSNTGLMQSDGTLRPAMTWLMDFLHR